MRQFRRLPPIDRAGTGQQEFPGAAAGGQTPAPAGCPSTIVSNISSGFSSLSFALASVAAWITWENLPGGNSNERMSPVCKLNGRMRGQVGRFGRNAAGLRVNTTAEAPSLSLSLAQTKLSSSQQPKKPVPPVMKIRCPRNSSHKPCGVGQNVVKVVSQRVHSQASVRTGPPGTPRASNCWLERREHDGRAGEIEDGGGGQRTEDGRPRQVKDGDGVQRDAAGEASGGLGVGRHCAGQSCRLAFP